MQSVTAHLNNTRSSQRGATLIVVLVILIAMTFLGLGAMSDTNMQLAMVRNSQLQTGAYTSALSEINVQLDTINNNPVGATDQVLVDLVQKNTTTIDGFESRSLLSTDGEIALLLGGVLDADFAHYQTSLVLTEPNAENFLPLPNFSLAPDSTIRNRLMEFDSSARITNTGTESRQIQGFSYIAPN